MFHGVFQPPPLEDYPEAMRESVAKLHRAIRIRTAVGRFLAVLFYLAIVVLLAMAAAIIAMATDRAPPVHAKVEIKTPEVPPGGKLLMRVEVQRDRVCQSKVTFRVYDGEGKLTIAEMPWTDAAGPIGADPPFIRALTLSREASPGPARLRIERSYRCPINLIHEVWPITDFDPDRSFTIGEPQSVDPATAGSKAGR